MQEWWRDDQALAYAIVEQGRVACARLLEQDPVPRDKRGLVAAHNGFGLAGFLASDHLLPGVRPAVHVMVEETGPARTPALRTTDPLHQALLFAIHGAAAIERCLATPWLLEQMRQAHRSVRQAHVALTTMAGLGLAARLTVEESDAGHLERAWQQRHLRPRTLAEAGSRPTAPLHQPVPA
jgi:hypothetical protein